MAIEITSKAKVKTSVWTIILLVIGFLLLFGLLISYFYFDNSSKKIKELLKKSPQEVFLEEQIKQKERALSLYKEKIDTFGALLADHRNVAEIFSFLEGISLPNVWFSKFDFNYAQQTIGVSGQTDNFIGLWQQIDILKKEPLLKNINLTSVGPGEEGVDFSLSLQFDPRVFQK
ncbi:MAG: hypothetical protein FJZ07_01345 [Candidatus Nealsonbacteria bacterium]|nr:hypothetical protein [Candidatus Nealsonbacteria bacterium]